MILHNFLIKIKYFLPITRNMSENVAKKIKYDGRSKKRKWEDRRSDKGLSNESKKACEENSLTPFERIKRRKYAMLLSYSGQDYFGMQRNPNMKTIEEDLLTALFKAGFITDEAFNQIQTVQFQRAARTDKGVSASRQIVSLKLPEIVDVASINDHLPETIRVFSLKRVTKGFNSKSQCDARTYIYLMPTYSFVKSSEVESLESYRITPEKIETVNNVLNKFLGSKNFHNFTSRKRFNDPSAIRYIISFCCDNPIIRKDQEFVMLKVKGQSFMLHQIRKMIGLMLAVVRGHTTEETITRSWTSDRLDIPMAPGLGLVLDQVHYERYNERYGKDGMHDSLDWLEVEEEVNAFRDKYILSSIIDTEIESKAMLEWLETLSYHSYDIREEDLQNDCGEKDAENSNSSGKD